MHVLFLTHYFPPEVNAPANRTFEHARRWVADGHQVTVITGVPNHPKGTLFPGYQNRWHQEEEMEGIRVVRTWMFLGPPDTSWARSINYLVFLFTALFASFRVKAPDVVVATTPQFFCGVAGLLVARMKRRPFVLEVRDLWPDSIIQLLGLDSRFVIGALEWIERWLYRSTAGIVVNSPAFVDHIATFGVPRERMALIYNGVDPSIFELRERDPALLCEHGLDGKFLVGYVGTLGMAHGLVSVVEAAETLRSDPNIVFVLIGDGADRVHLEREVEKRGLHNVHLIGLRPRAEIPAWIASLDVSLVLLRDIAVLETVIPSKIFETLVEARPVVLAARGAIRKLVEDANAGYVIDPEDTNALVKAIQQIRAHPEEAARRAQTGRTWVLAHFNRESLARQMARFLEECVLRRA